MDCIFLVVCFGFLSQVSATISIESGSITFNDNPSSYQLQGGVALQADVSFTIDSDLTTDTLTTATTFAIYFNDDFKYDSGIPLVITGLDTALFNVAHANSGFFQELNDVGGLSTVLYLQVATTIPVPKNDVPEAKTISFTISPQNGLKAPLAGVDVMDVGFALRESDADIATVIAVSAPTLFNGFITVSVDADTFLDTADWPTATFTKAFTTTAFGDTWTPFSPDVGSSLANKLRPHTRLTLSLNTVVENQVGQFIGLRLPEANLDTEVTNNTPSYEIVTTGGCFAGVDALTFGLAESSALTYGLDAGKQGTKKDLTIQFEIKFADKACNIEVVLAEVQLSFDPSTSHYYSYVFSSTLHRLPVEVTYGDSPDTDRVRVDKFHFSPPFIGTSGRPVEKYEFVMHNYVHWTQPRFSVKLDTHSDTDQITLESVGTYECDANTPNQRYANAVQASLSGDAINFFISRSLAPLDMIRITCPGVDITPAPRTGLYLYSSGAYPLQAVFLFEHTAVRTDVQKVTQSQQFGLGGDPILHGFNNEKFIFYGREGGIYNLISSEFYQFNMRLKKYYAVQNSGFEGFTQEHSHLGFFKKSEGATECIDVISFIDEVGIVFANGGTFYVNRTDVAASNLPAGVTVQTTKEKIVKKYSWSLDHHHVAFRKTKLSMQFFPYEIDFLLSFAPSAPYSFVVFLDVTFPHPDAVSNRFAVSSAFAGILGQTAGLPLKDVETIAQIDESDFMPDFGVDNGMCELISHNVSYRGISFCLPDADEVIDGVEADYKILGDDIFGTDFKFNKFAFTN